MKFLDFGLKLAEGAGKIILKNAKKTLTIKEKSLNNLVTNADKASEAFIIKTIKSAFPDHAIIAEESSDGKFSEEYKNADYLWIIDPLDGTTNFAHGLPLYSVSIALCEIKKAESSKNFDYLSAEIIFGIVHAPALNETFYAQKGKGAYLNGKKISVSPTGKVEKSLFVTGFPPVNQKLNMPYFLTMMKQCQAIRRLGSAALDLAYVACGRFEGHWEFGLKPWDIAAGSLIVAEAGGKVTDINGNQLDLFGADILATNGKIHKKTIEIFKTIG
ncbi:MAG: inositol monophosphatase family protein [Patescibacteria group bacterium]